MTVKFWAAGLKGDQDGRIAINHSNTSLSYQAELRGFLKHFVMPRVEKYLFALLDTPRDRYASLDVSCPFLRGYTSATCGHLFFNRMHTDEDVWVTVLVALGDCARGGGFAHATAGVVHQVSAGDILVVNPAQPHCTAEFGDVTATRRMLAVFVSLNAFRASLASVQVAARCELPAYRRARKRKR